MQVKVNLVLLGTLIVIWGLTTLAEPAAALDPTARGTDELASLEDACATHRSDPEIALELADRYLALERPRLAVNVLSSAPSSVREDPAVLHRLAMAYEQTGRMNDAVATARLARARCGRSLGTSESSYVTPPPARACSERTYAALDRHVSALSTMLLWGVTDVRHDERARRAYLLSVRNVRILSASAD